MILVYTETQQGNFKKSAFELISYAKALGEKVIALAINANEANLLQQYGADKIIQVQSQVLNTFSAQAFASVIEQVARKEQVQTILLSNSTNARYIAPIVAIKWEAAYLPNVSSLPEQQKFEKVVFSSKAQAKITTQNPLKVISLSQNSFGVKENPTTATIEDFTPNLPENLFAIKQISEEKASGKVSLQEASVVVSGGRGLKAPENWHLVEDLARVLNAATGCTKPISDMGWRPHAEHIGQTGKPLACNLYIALGISGAIQHLAGVNACKVKVVINTDPEAPFFKAADYGIVGDIFEVVPQLIEKLSKS